MSYTALYRKFRPSSFDEVKGQEHIVKTLQNQVKADRLGHAYLFCGTRGTGKTTVAKILAKTVNCENPVEGSPCGECPMCKAISAGVSTNVIEIDAASNNGVDNVREIREEVTYRPTSGRYKVYIIDEVHMLSTGAFNALLKTLEEPPEYVIFILATTEVNKIPVTILSRCQRYDFRRISQETIADRMRDLLAQEGVEAEDRAVSYIARAADGSMRDALSLLDQCIAFYLGEPLTYDKVLQVLGTVDTDVFSKLLRFVHSGDTAESLRILDELVMQGKELTQFVNDFTWYLRNLMLIQHSDDLEDVLDVSTENLQQLKEESRMVDQDTLMRYIRVFSELSGQIRFAAQKRILVEVGLIRLSRPQMETNLDSVLDRIRVLEEKAEQGGFAQPVYTQAPVQTVEAEVEEVIPPRVAAPADLKQIRQQWNQIISRTTQPLRTYLSASSPKYNGDTGEPKLYIECPDKTVSEIVNHPDKLEELKMVIAQTAGVQVELTAVSTGGAGDRLSDIPLEERLKTEINMDIEIEE